MNIFENCYSTGNISGNYRIGGVVGYNIPNIQRFVNAIALNQSIVATDNTTDIGRVVGYNETFGILTNNYARSSGMTLETGLGPYTPPDTVNADNNKDGANVDAGTGPSQYYSQDFWENTMGWSFSGLDPVWEMGPGPNPLPKLIGVGP